MEVSCIPCYCANFISRKEVSPSLFLAELPPQLLEAQDTTESGKQTSEALVALLSPRTAKINTKEKQDLKNIIENDLVLSATALTTFQQCAYNRRKRHISSLFHHIYTRQVSVFLIIVKAVSYKENIFCIEAKIIYF